MKRTDCMLEPVVISGRGVVAAIGCDIASFTASLAAGRGGILAYPGLNGGAQADSQLSAIRGADGGIHAGLALPFAAVEQAAASASGGADHTALMASRAAIDALSEAGLYADGALQCDGARVALLLGTSHGGRSQLDRFVETGMDADDAGQAAAVLERALHHHQSAVVAAAIGVRGPVLTFSTACSSSGTAITHAVDLLRAEIADVVIAGGADAFSKLTQAGFAALGATADGPCGPFGNVIGMTLGEGSGFVVMERATDCAARGGSALAQILGCATSWDAHHLTAPEPSGHGMSRAIEAALRMGDLQPGDIDFISAHATGTRANDLAETLAIKRVWEGIEAPPVSASKSYTGHTLGASSVMGLLAALAAVDSGVLPPTLHFDSPRPGCDLDYVPRTPRRRQVERFLAQSAAFGGANCVIAGAAAGLHAALPVPPPNAVHITGLGVLSSLGSTAAGFYDAWRDGASGFDAVAAQAGTATAKVAGFDPRRHLPPGSNPRIGRIAQLALAAAEQALNDAGLAGRARAGKKIGLMVGLCRGAASSFESYLDSVRGAQWDQASALAFPNLVMSSVGGKVSIALCLTGPASTIVGGADVGLSLIGSAAEYLRRRDEIDALVVLAADELTPLYLRLQQARSGVPAIPYAEGAVALVLQREDRVAASGCAPVNIAGWDQTCDAGTGPRPREDGDGLAACIGGALRRAGVTPDQVDAVFGASSGVPGYDMREQQAHRSVFGGAARAVQSPLAQTGVAEASGALFAVAAAIGAMREAADGPASALIAATSEFGSNCALLLRRRRELPPC